MVRGDTEKLVMGVCGRIWKETYGAGGTEADALRRIGVLVEQMQSGSNLPDDTPTTDTVRFVFATQWIHGGCVTLTTTHKFAAALAASTVSREVLSDIRLPASAFRVEVPNGILSSSEFGFDFSQINVCLLENGRAILAIEGLGRVASDGGRRLAILPTSWTPGPDSTSAPLVEILSDKSDDERIWLMSQHAAQQHSPGDMDARERVASLARRIVAGLLLTFSHTTNWRERSVGARGERKRDGPPPHRNIFIGRPISYDARPAIAQYLGGHAKGPPSVQTLVRGHYKRQVVGPLRAGRKVIWIEPYWRGPEDAPILSHPHHVSPEKRTGPAPGGGAEPAQE